LFLLNFAVVTIAPSKGKNGFWGPGDAEAVQSISTDPTLTGFRSLCTASAIKMLIPANHQNNYANGLANSLPLFMGIWPCFADRPAAEIAQQDFSLCTTIACSMSS